MNRKKRRMDMEMDKEKRKKRGREGWRKKMKKKKKQNAMYKYQSLEIFIHLNYLSSRKHGKVKLVFRPPGYAVAKCVNLISLSMQEESIMIPSSHRST